MHFTLNCDLSLAFHIKWWSESRISHWVVAWVLNFTLSGALSLEFHIKWWNFIGLRLVTPFFIFSSYYKYIFSSFHPTYFIFSSLLHLHVISSFHLFILFYFIFSSFHLYYTHFFILFISSFHLFMFITTYFISSVSGGLSLDFHSEWWPEFELIQMSGGLSHEFHIKWWPESWISH